MTYDECNQRFLTNFFDSTSLFTNVSIADAIQICADALYSSEHPPAPFSRHTFVVIMEMATFFVELNFDNIMHHQIDGVAMGSSFWTSPCQYNCCWLP